MISIIKGNIYSYIEGDISFQLRASISDMLSYFKDGYIFAPSYKSGGWDGRIRLFAKKSYGTRNGFPTGLIPYVTKFLQNKGIPFEIVNKTAYPDGEVIFTEEPPDDIDVLRDYQVEAVEAVLKNKQMIINLPTGTGKTVVGAEVIREVNQQNTLFCVYHSKELLYQTAERFEHQLQQDIGKIGDSSYELQPITVGITDSIAQSIKNNNKEILDYLKSVKCVIFDEVHHARAETVQAISKACVNAEYRVGLSATPVRDAGDDLEIYAYIGPILYKKTITQMVDAGYLVQPTIYFIELSGASKIAYRNYRDLISEYICDNPKRDGFIADMAVQLEELGHRGVVLVEQVSHGEALTKLIPNSDYIHGGDSTTFRKNVIADLTTGEIKTVVATSILREGVDIPPASYLIHAHPFKSFVVTWQRNGRVLRPSPGKKKAIIVDISDMGNKWLPAQARRRLKYYNQEPCFNIIHKKVSL